jgi:broad specificity phosphatase PhoE
MKSSSLVFAAVAALPMPLVKVLLSLTKPSVVLLPWRHGEQPDNLGTAPQRVLSGWTAVPLTTRGALQALSAGRYGKLLLGCFNKSVIVSSDVYRSVETTVGFLLGAGNPDIAVFFSPLARERNAGVYNRMSRAQAAASGCGVLNLDGSGSIFASVDASYATEDDLPGCPGESARDVYERGTQLLQRLLLASWFTGTEVVGVSTHEIWIKVVRFGLSNGGVLDDRAFAEKVSHALPELLMISFDGINVVSNSID